MMIALVAEVDTSQTADTHPPIHTHVHAVVMLHKCALKCHLSHLPNYQVNLIQDGQTSFWLEAMQHK